jgi:predicted PhzF superfamily epimerase YddE/YHI9
MKIIGCDFHPSFQQIAMVDTETGEQEEKRLTPGEAVQFYGHLQGQRVLIGMEASGNTLWFERLLAGLGHQMRLGDASKIRAMEVRKQKTDRRDAELLLKLLPSGAPSPTDLGSVLSIEPAEVSQVFFADAGVPFCFAQLSSNEVVDRVTINRAAWAATLSRAWSPHLFLFAGDLRDGGKLYARMWAPALGVEEDSATGSACAALVGAMALKHDFGGTTYHLSIQQGVSMGRPSEIEAEARKSGSVVTSVSVGGATAYIASGEIEVPPSALVSQTT